MAAILAICGAAGVVTRAPPARAQAAVFDDVEAQLHIRQAVNAAATAALEVDDLRKALEAERKRVVLTNEERDLNRETIKTLEVKLREAEARQRERDAALKQAQEARRQGLAAEAQRQKPETVPLSAVPHGAPGWSTDARTGCRVWNSNPEPGETMSWNGACQGSLAQGRGVLQWFKDGKPNGRYEGDYRDGKVNGRGVYSWASGTRFEGEFRDDRPDGPGTLTQSNGTVYSGIWTNGCFRQGDRKTSVMASRKECGFE
jgi:hypothetical protein